MPALISALSIAKSFHVGQQTVPVLRNISLEIQPNDFTVIIGPSGCGKSTLLHVLLGLEEPTEGKVMMGQLDIYQDQDEDDRAEYRKQHLGLIFQKPNWVQALNVLENVMFPLMLLDEDKTESRSKAVQSLELVGMSNWAEYLPQELSSGQQQKVALARAIITDPELIVADEPTGNLDYESGQQLMDLLTGLHQQGKAILMVSHDLEYMRYAQTAVRMFNGQIAETTHGQQVEAMAEELQQKRRRKQT